MKIEVYPSDVTSRPTSRPKTTEGGSSFKTTVHATFSLEKGTKLPMQYYLSSKINNNLLPFANIPIYIIDPNIIIAQDIYLS